jgi:hypothetical protein
MAGDNPGIAFPAATLLGPMISMFGAMANWAAANRDRFDQLDAGPATLGPPDRQHSPSPADLLLPIGQAMMIATNRSVSYWLGLAHILESHQMTLAQVIGTAAIEGGAAGSERLAMTDNLRALLREVGDLATREARIFQSQLSDLDESLTQSFFQQPEPSGSYRRRWRAKA